MKKTFLQLVVVVVIAFAAAGVTFWIKGPPGRAVVCDPAKLPADEVCLDRVMNEWNGQVLWLDARSREEWERNGVEGSLLWNLDTNESMQAFEAEAAGRLLEGPRVVVYCSNENCGTSRQVAERVRALDMGNEVFVLHGGWRALSAAGLSRNKPQAGARLEPPPGGLTFEHSEMDVPVAADAKSAVVDFKFENKSPKPVTIAKYEKTCSCLSVMVSNGKLTYQSGESGVIRASFELGNLSGIVEKQILLWLDQDPDDKPSLTLTARVHIPVLVEMDGKTLIWNVGGNPEPRKIDIKMADTKPIRILSTHCSSDAFKIELKTLVDGEHYELWVTPLNTSEPGLGIIGIETDCPIPRHKLQQAFATVR